MMQRGGMKRLQIWRLQKKDQKRNPKKKLQSPRFFPISIGIWGSPTSRDLGDGELVGRNLYPKLCLKWGPHLLLQSSIFQKLWKDFFSPLFKIFLDWGLMGSRKKKRSAEGGKRPLGKKEGRDGIRVLATKGSRTKADCPW